MNGRNSNAKSIKFSEHNAKISPENSIPLSKNLQKTELVSLSYDVNDMFTQKSKSI